MQTNLSTLENKINHHFRDRSLLEMALKHPSLDLGVHDNQRLEFLGDAVLDLIVAEALYLEHPESEEGKLDRMRAGIVSGKALAPKALELGLDQYLVVSEAQRAHHPKPSKGMLEDALEAVIGAVYLDGGFEAARQSVERILGEAIDQSAEQSAGGTPKNRLQEWTQKQHAGAKPHYTLVSAEGPDHARVYTVSVEIEDKSVGRGTGGSKKAAEVAAAEDALRKLQA